MHGVDRPVGGRGRRCCPDRRRCDTETGFLVKAGDAIELFEKLKLLIENEGLRKEMGLKAETFAEENFSKQKEVQNYRQLYQSLLTPKNIKRSVPQYV